MDNRNTELDRMDAILTAEDEIVPSSGFLGAVMERVEEEARMPAPIPFPWKRTLPGFVLAAGVFGWAGVELARRVVSAMNQGALAFPQLSAAMVMPMQQAGWVALALSLSMGSWLLARRLAGQSGLL